MVEKEDFWVNIEIGFYINDIQLLNACRDISISSGRLTWFRIHKDVPMFSIFFQNRDSKRIIYQCAKIRNFGY